MSRAEWDNRHPILYPLIHGMFHQRRHTEILQNIAVELETTIALFSELFSLTRLDSKLAHWHAG